MQLYEDWIRPTAIAQDITGLADSASLLWRLHLYGGADLPLPLPWNEVKTQATPAAAQPGPAFRDAHAALAFAAAGEQELLEQMLNRLRADGEKGNALAREIIRPLAQGIAAFAEGDYAAAVDFLEPVFPQLTRIGGSHAQREVL